MLHVVVGVLVMATASLGQCPTNCRCSDYVRKTFCQGSCDASLPPGINPNTVDFSAIGYNLTTLRRADLKGLPSLTDLSLDDNHIFVVEADAFRSLTQLVTLSLQDNFFESLDRDVIASNTKLVVLYLSQSSMLRFPSDGNFLNSTSLRSLFLENCRKLSARFDQNSSSDISVLDIGYFSGLKNLKELSLRNSGIDLLEVSIPVQPWYLSSFNLRNNFLKTIPVEFFLPFKALETLYLDNNWLELLPPGVFDPLKTLKKLFLGSNHLAQLDSGLFRSLAKLELLDLSENDLSSLDSDFFRGLVSLRSLILSGNTLQSLDAVLLFPLMDLETLDISANGFKAVDAVWFAGLENLDEIRITGLALRCDCELQRFWVEMSAARVQIITSCGSTEVLTNDTFSSLDCTSSTYTTAGYFSTSSVVWISVASSLAVLLLVLAVIGAYIICRRSRRTSVVDAGNSYLGVPTNDIYALPMKPSKPRPPPRPPRLASDED